MRKFLLLLTICLYLVSARRYIDLEEPLPQEEGWERVSEASDGEHIKLHIALKQRNLDVLEEIFTEVSDPTSTSYGKHLSRKQLIELVAPKEEDIQAVHDWLDDNGHIKKRLTGHRDMIEVHLTVEQAKQLLETEFHHFKHLNGMKVTRSLGPYSAPNHVAHKIDFITGHLGLDRNPNQEVHAHTSGFSRLKKSEISITPIMIRQRYNITKESIGGNKKNSQAVSEFLNSFFSPVDLEQFFRQFWSEENYNASVHRTIGENRPNEASEHGSLDLQYIMGVAPNVPTWFYSHTGSDFFSDLTEWVSHLAATETGKMPWVHSVAFGNQGEGPSQEYRQRMNVEFMKLGSQGLSIIVAAGDMGTGCYICWYYEPTFPATSPYVTTVGSTKFESQKIGPEIAVSEFKTGGGFSWHFVQPDYQTQLVTKYFANNDRIPEAHFFNRNGRGIPDVAALGSGYQIIQSGTNRIVYGSASSTSTFAAIVSLLNEIRLNKNKPTLGFLNPLLYQTRTNVEESFFDVTQGNNQYGCCGWTGFYAGPGWDPVSGLGTPNFRVLKEVVKNLP